MGERERTRVGERCMERVRITRMRVRMHREIKIVTIREGEKTVRSKREQESLRQRVRGAMSERETPQRERERGVTGKTE